jgi:hypothetical protein
VANNDEVCPRRLILQARLRDEEGAIHRLRRDDGEAFRRRLGEAGRAGEEQQRQGQGAGEAFPRPEREGELHFTFKIGAGKRRL